MKLKHMCIILTLILPWLLNSAPFPIARAAGYPVNPAVAPGQVPDGLSAAEWETIQEQVRQAEYHYTWHEPGAAYVAPNRVQGWHMVLGTDGLHLHPGVDQAEADWELQLRLTAWGYAGRLRPVTGEPVQRAEDGRVTYQWDGVLTEWYVNDARGLEHGFTLAHPPAPSQSWEGERVPAQRVAAGESLVLELGITTDLRPHLTADGQTLLFADAEGQTVLRYAALQVTDATGQVLPARLEIEARHASRITDHALRIVIDDAGALYPLTLDPLLASQVAKLTAADGAVGDEFGVYVSVSGDTAVVGARHADVGGRSNQGAAYVFYRDQGGVDAWGQVKKVTAADGAAGDWFGQSVSISGDTVVVGAYLANVAGKPFQGAAYVFERNQGGADNWGQVRKLIAADGAANDWFGLRVSIDGDTVVVGSRYADIGGRSDQGAAYIFYRNQGGPDNWGQVKKLTAADGAAGDIFGCRVSLGEDTMVVGAPWADVDGRSDQGAAYVFYRDQGGADAWGQVTKLTNADGTAGDMFGNQVSVSGETLAVAAPHASIGGNTDQGTAYIFYRNQGGPDNWGQVKKLTAADGAAGDRFGVSVSVRTNLVVVAAQYADVGGNDEQGTAYIFYRDQGGPDNWGQVAKLTADDGAAGDWFGISVSISGDTVVIGARNADIDGNVDQSAAYVYRLTYQTCLPLVLRNYAPAEFPLHIGGPIPTRPVAHQGEVFYTKVLRIPDQLPAGGKFYFSSQPDMVTEVLVDDELAILSGGVEVFSYNFSSGGSPRPAIVEVPRTVMEQLAGKTVSIEYRDIYGSVVEASDMWLIWVP